jgi:hypothetical protein
VYNITAAAFAAKFKSKKEIYHLLAVEAKKYLPHVDTVTIYFLKEIINKTKRGKSLPFIFTRLLLAFNGADIRHLHCPQYETLSTNLIIAWAKTQSPLV